jgi:hypothetical protein
MSGVRIASLHVYPVKGCRGIAVTRAVAAVTGLVADGAGDREWMVVGTDGRFLTQRELPRLALVDVGVTASGLTLRAPGGGSCAVPRDVGAPARDVVVWRSEVRGVDAGDVAARWLCDWLDHEVRLVRFDRTLPRPCNTDYAGDSGAHTMFADGYPVLVANTASLADLNERLLARGEAAVPMNRFRPNVVIDGLPAYDEDHVDTIAAGSVVLRFVKPCTRCTVTTVDQATARTGNEPLRTLSGYRMNREVDGVTFAMNAIVAEGAGGELAAASDVEVRYRFDA